MTEAFCAYENKNAATRKVYPWLLCVQTSLINQIDTRVVIPLARRAEISLQPLKTLNPLFYVNEDYCMALTQNLSVVRCSQLGQKICDCSNQRQQILAAIDFLVTGI